MNKTKLAAAVTAACAMLGVAAFAPTPAQAFQTGLSDRAYCFNSPGDYGIGRICNFDTYAQCAATARGINGYCEVNPWYAYGNAPPQPYQPRRRARAY